MAPGYVHCRRVYLIGVGGVRFEQLRYAEAAGRHGSLRKAADELGISQPSLSQQIQRLEEDLGVVLFIRRPNGVRFTDAGATLMPRFRSALRLEDGIRQQASAIGGARVGRIHLGVVPTACRALLPRCIRNFQAMYPNIQFQITEGGSGALRESVSRGELDLAVVSMFVDDAYPDLLVSELCIDPLVACVPAGHRLSVKSSVTAADLEDEPMIVHDRGYILSRAFDRLSAGRRLRPVVFAESTETAREFVSASVGVTIMPRMALVTQSIPRDDVAIVPLAPEWARLQVAVIRRADEHPTPASQALVRLLRSAAARLTEKSG